MAVKIYFRADGNFQIGLGHVTRTLALADMLSTDFDVHFIIRNPLPAIKSQILEVCQTIAELPDTDDDYEEAQFLADNLLSSDEIIVLDGYHFVTEYQQIFKDKGCKVVCIDDIHAYHFVADVVINHAPGLESSIYSTESYTKLCLGLDYSLIRKPFLEAAKKKREITNIRNIFICFGGSDFNNITINVLKAVVDNDINVNQINVVLGEANEYQEEVKNYIQGVKYPHITLQSNLSSTEMCELMQECDLAIVPASSILFEIIAVKMPVISGYFADNQFNIYKGFKALGLIFGVGNLNTFDSFIDCLINIFNENYSDIINNQFQNQKGASKDNYLHLFNKICA